MIPPTARRRSNRGALIAAAIAGVLLIVGIRWFTSRGTDDATTTPGSQTTSSSGLPPRDGCIAVTVAPSSEKAALMGQIAEGYRDSGRTVDGRCFDVTVNSVASGTGEAALAAGWNPSADGTQPDVWTPAASTWVSLLRTDLISKDRPDILPPASGPIASVTSTPLVLAMPEPMAKALGWPEAQLGWADVLALANDPQGWASKGHPEWNKFTLGKTNPTVSTSGLAATIGTLVAATGTSSDLTIKALEDPGVQKFLKDVESSVVHYGDTTLTYLSNLQRADDAGGALNYLSAVAVEEKSVLDYNAGNPSGNPATLGQHAPPKVPLVAIYPKEGTLYSDSPYVVLNAPWSTADKKAGAADFLAYLQQPEQQTLFTTNFFRTADHQPGKPITDSPYLIADGVKITLNPPGPEVLAKVRSVWSDVRKPARILVLLDVSGSMQSDAGNGQSKLELAKTAATAALGQLVDTDPVGTAGKTRLELAKTAAAKAITAFSDTDQVGLWTFTTQLNTPTGITDELVPIAPLSQNRGQLTSAIAGLQFQNGTPLYAATKLAVKAMNDTADPDYINAVVLLTDGRNEYTDNDVDSLVSQLSNGALEGGVRVFSIAYGSDADLDTLKLISEASRAAAYDARDASNITKVFANVLSNF